MTMNANSNNAQAFEPMTAREDYVSYAQNATTQVARSTTAKYFLATDDKMLRIQDVIEQIAHANVPVLVTGESGVGKEIVAKAIHKASHRRDRPFVAINCAALPPALLEAKPLGVSESPCMLPRCATLAKPAPISTPLTALMPIMA